MTKKTKERASADVGFIFIAYNLKRMMKIIGTARLIDLFALFITVLWLENYRNQLKSRFYHHSTKNTGTVKITEFLFTTEKFSNFDRMAIHKRGF